MYAMLQSNETARQSQLNDVLSQGGSTLPLVCIDVHARVSSMSRASTHIGCQCENTFLAPTNRCMPLTGVDARAVWPHLQLSPLTLDSRKSLPHRKPMDFTEDVEVNISESAYLCSAADVSIRRLSTRWHARVEPSDVVMSFPSMLTSVTWHTRRLTDRRIGLSYVIHELDLSRHLQTDNGRRAWIADEMVLCQSRPQSLVLIFFCLLSVHFESSSWRLDAAASKQRSGLGFG